MVQIREYLLPDFPISPNGLSSAYGEIEAAVAAAGLPLQLAQRLCVILDEVYANLQSHDRTLGTDDKIGLTFTPGPNEITVEISDTGQPFDPMNVPIDEEAGLGGQGLRLIKGLASSISYENDGERNRLKVTLRHLDMTNS